jgi:hypothetical protein
MELFDLSTFAGLLARNHGLACSVLGSADVDDLVKCVPVVVP